MAERMPVVELQNGYNQPLPVPPPAPREPQDVTMQPSQDRLVEFFHHQKCEACQLRHRDCVIKSTADKCLLCADAERECTFERLVYVPLRGPPNRFSRAVLLSANPSIRPQHVDSPIGHLV